MTLFVRAITSFCYATLLLGSLYINALFFALVVFIMALISLLEIQHISKQKTPIIYLFYPVMLVFSYSTEQLHIPLLVLGIIGVLLMVIFFWNRTKIATANVFIHVLGFIGISIPLVLLVLLGNQNPNFVAFFFGIIWLNDTSAYIIGSSIGKRALAPNISPNKTIEGSIGGVALSTAIMFFLGSYFEILDSKTLLIVCIITAIFGGLGDLIQSKIKRQCGVKDSGKILPGHGGMYDRLDSLLLAIPLYIFILIVFGYVS
jgi:phosphatidate cytidylyltransferase